MATMAVPETNLLTLEDWHIETVLEVYAATAIDDGREGLPGIIPLKGPEMGEYFGGKWASMPSLGTQRYQAQDSDIGRITNRPSRLLQRHFRLEFVGSLRWPKGVPVGYVDVHEPTQLTVAGAVKPEFSHAEADICGREMERLEAIANYKRPLTKFQRRQQEAQREAVRMHRESPDMTNFVKMLQGALGAQAAQAALPPNTPPVVSAEPVQVPGPDDLLVKRRFVETDEGRRLRFFVETQGEDRVAGPFTSEDEAREAM